MTSKKSIQERRKNPRVRTNIPIKICQEDGDSVTETGNLSRSGAYCSVTRYIEPMTKLGVQLLIPIKKEGKKATKKINCQGVVVRVEPGSKDNHYDIAVFFNDISRRDSEIIADYIDFFAEKE